jgi:Spx/MgsR family transcriptional regulator
MNSCTVYGIPNCDSVKKVCTWLKENDVAFTFHNYKTASIDKQTLSEWCDAVGWEKLLNKKGTTWKKIAPDYEGKTLDENLAVDIMLEHTSTIKRPVVITSKGISVGVDFEALKSIL